MSALSPELTTPALPERPASRRRRVSHENLVLAVILMCQLMVVLDATIVNVALPKMKDALGFSPAGLSWVLNAYTLTFGGLLLLGARAGDLMGRRKTFVAGVVVFTVASLLGGFATSSGFLLAARALQGIGGALAAPSSLALMTTMFPEGRQRLRAIALFTAVSVSGGALGLILGGMLTEWASWRWVMFVNVPIGIAVVVAGRALLPETEPHSGRFDIAGALTSTGGMGLLVYGFVRAATEGWSDLWTVGSFAAGVLLLGSFVRVELSAAEPITPLRLLADRSRTSANVARGLLFAGMFGMFFFLTQYLQEVLHYSALKAGFAFLPMPTTVFVVSQLTSRLSHRIPARLLMLGGVALAATGFLLASGLGEHSSYAHVFGCLIFFAIGNGLSFVPLTSAALAGVPPQDAGAASGLVNVTQQLGGALGVAVLVTVAGSATKHAGGSPAHAFVVGATHAFAGSAVFLLVALVLVAALVRPGAAQH
ncbi:MAG: MFS transporter [Mycobacteriales bacterium]